MYSHRALAKMIYASNSADEIAGTIREYFGNKASIIYNIVYFVSIYTIVLKCIQLHLQILQVVFV